MCVCVCGVSPCHALCSPASVDWRAKWGAQLAQLRSRGRKRKRLVSRPTIAQQKTPNWLWGSNDFNSIMMSSAGCKTGQTVCKDQRQASAGRPKGSQKGARLAGRFVCVCVAQSFPLCGRPKSANYTCKLGENCCPLVARCGPMAGGCLAGGCLAV